MIVSFEGFFGLCDVRKRTSFFLIIDGRVRRIDFILMRTKIIHDLKNGVTYPNHSTLIEQSAIGVFLSEFQCLDENLLVIGQKRRVLKKLFRLFRSLIKVSGVGPKIALALLSGISVAAFAQCVQKEDVTTLTRIPGVGRKTAERLIVEMRDRLVAAEEGASAPAAAGGVSAESEAFDALVALGYRPAEATRLLKGVAPGTHSTEELIRRALKSAVRE